MFGNNPVAPIIHKQQDGDVLQVVSPGPWRTIQGEGPYAGYPATFIRLHGCNLRCTFCDTQFSNPSDPLMSIEALVKVCVVNGHKLVVITGGEPFRQNILPLCKMLSELQFLVQIETAGTIWIEDVQNYAKIVVSPKTPTINPRIRSCATAFKYVISADNQHEGYLPITATQPDGKVATLAPPRNGGAAVYLSPMDQYDPEKNKRNHHLVAELAMKHNVYAGVQLHKFLSVE